MIHSNNKIIFYPLSALHVVVTDLVYTQWRRLIGIWRKKQLNEECRRQFLRLKSNDNLNEIIYCKNILKKMVKPNSNITYMISELIRVYEVQIQIERKNKYYRSIYWEDLQEN